MRFPLPPCHRTLLLELLVCLMYTCFVQKDIMPGTAVRKSEVVSVENSKEEKYYDNFEVEPQHYKLLMKELLKKTNLNTYEDLEDLL